MSSTPLPWEEAAAAAGQKSQLMPWEEAQKQQGPPIPPVTRMTSPKLNIAASGENMPEVAGAVGAAGAGLMAGAALGETPFVGPAVKWAAKKVAPIALPAAGSYLINQARQWPVVGPVIKHIPFAEMLPWLVGGGKGEKAKAEAAEAETPLTTPTRTLPGMNPPEVIRPPAQPIPPRSGLMLRGETEQPIIPASRVSTTPPESLSKSTRIAQAKAINSIPAVKDWSTLLPRLQAIAKQIQEQEAPKAEASLAPALEKSLPQARLEGKIMQLVRKEGGLSIGKDRLTNSPELRGVDPDQLQKAVIHLRDQGKIWHETTGGGAHPESYTVALKKR